MLISVNHKRTFAEWLWFIKDNKFNQEELTFHNPYFMPHEKTFYVFRKKMEVVNCK